MTRVSREKLNNVEELVIVPDGDPFYWILALEYLVEKKFEIGKCAVITLKTRPLKGLKSSIKHLLGWCGAEMQISELIRKNGTPVYSVSRYFSGIKINRKVFQELKAYTYPSVVADRKNRRLNSIIDRLYWSRVILVNLSLYNFLTNLKLNDRIKVLVPNGRNANSAVCVNKFRQNGHSVEIIDSGADPLKFQVWKKSAQSQREAEEILLTMWHSAPSPERETVSERYFVSRLDGSFVDPYHQVSWRNLVRNQKLPEIKDDMKIATFYSSSQIEFVGSDPIESNLFQDQGEALLALLKVLDSDNWRVILRLHPKPSNPISQFDDESDIWNECLKFKHLIIVDSESDIDSFTLAESSQFVAHFNSSIGAEILFAELAPVITMGPTCWASLGAGYQARNLEQLKTLLSLKNLTVARKTQILPWGFFYASHGTNFKVVSRNKYNEWTIGERVVEEKFLRFLRRVLSERALPN